MNDRQSRDELAAFFGSDSAADVVYRWSMLIVRDGNLEAAWALLTPAYRDKLVRAVIESNRVVLESLSLDLNVLVQGWVARTAPEQHQAQFDETQLREFCEVLPGLDELTDESWGIASRPRLLSPDRQLIVLAKSCGQITFDEPTPLPAVTFTMEFGDDQRWRIDSINEDQST